MMRVRFLPEIFEKFKNFYYNIFMKDMKEKEIIKEFEYEEPQEYQPVIGDSYNFEPIGFYYKNETENWGDFEG